MYDIKVEDLAKANGLSPKVRIGQGLVLLLPSKASINRKLQTNKNNAKVKKVYAVKKGDSFAKIASKYGISEKDLKKWNPGIRSNGLVKGKRLTMYTKATQITVSKKSKNSKGISTSKSSHTIRKGESLSKIADKYGISVQQLTKINNNIKPRDLKAGQTIKLK
jgi:LysM repeat protein